ncbi:MAG: glycosyltransferase family 4 protein [Muribaculaceae bacterium]|nr:glycosyltransferase family 4 protein [Muribaculaceae bacterium]
MNVLMCCSDLSYKGGMVSVAKNLLSSLPAREGVKVMFVPTHCDGSKLKMAWRFLTAFARIARMAAGGRIDVAHLHVSERGSFVRKGLLLRLLHRYHVPVVLHHHGAEFEPWYASLSPGNRRRVDAILREADVNIVLSRRLIPMITDKVADARVEAVYNSVPTLKANPYTGRERGVLLLGRLGQRKGAFDLIEAVKLIDRDIPEDIQFYFCGDGEVEEVRRRISEAGLSHRVAHVGWIAGKEKEEILSQTMINVLPSYHEGLPMTILETMACGIPNISTPVASIPEVITNGVTGLLVEPGDVKGLAGALKRLINTPAERMALSQASFSLIAERFSMEAATDRLMEIYAGVER